MARPKATPEHRRQVRRAIQSATAELYREEGVAAISARAVATRAGVSVGTIYSYFGDLTGLMQSLWTGRIAKLEEEFRARAGEFEDPIDRLEALLETYLRFGIEQTILYRNALMFVRPAALEPPKKQDLSAFAFPTLVTEAIRQGQVQGQIVDGDPVQLTQLLWSGAHGALALPINMDRVDFTPTAEIVEVTKAGLMRMVRA